MPTPSIAELVVPADTEARDFSPFDAYSVAAFVDRDLIGALNQRRQESPIVRVRTGTGQRAMHVVLATSSLVPEAPAEVRALVSQLQNATPESYILYSVIGGDIWVVATTSHGLRHGCYDVLQRAGARFYLPHPTWYEAPAADISFAESAVVIPVFRDFFFDGNGGLGSYDPVDSVKRTSPARFVEANRFWRTWAAQNRHPREWAATSFSDGDEGFMPRFQCELRHDRSMLAWVASVAQRGYALDAAPHEFPKECFDSSVVVCAKLNYCHHGPPGHRPPVAARGPSPWLFAPPPHASGCSTSPAAPCRLAPDPRADSDVDPYPYEYSSFSGLVELHATYHYEVLCERIRKYGPDNARTRWVGVEPTDGGSHCECSKCVNLLRRGPYGFELTPEQRQRDSTISDRVFHLANENAKHIARQFQNSGYKPLGVGLLAYHEHGDVPSIPLEPNMIVYLLPSAFGWANVTSAELQSAWAGKRLSNTRGQFSLGVMPSWLLSDTNFDVPKLSPRDAARDTRFWLKNGWVGFDAQTTYSSMCVGLLFWIVAKQSWDPDVDVESLIGDFFSALGPPGVIVRRMCERWYDWFELSHHEIAQSYADLDEAQNALDRAPTEKSQRRLDHYRAFVHWLRLNLEFKVALAAYAKAVDDPTRLDLERAIDAASSFLWSIKTWNIVQVDRLAQKMYLRIPRTSLSLLSKWDRGGTHVAGVAAASPPSTSALTVIVAAGRKTYPLLEGAQRRSFRMDDLVPLHAVSPSAGSARGFMCQALQRYRFVKGKANIELQFEQLVLARSAAPFRVQVLSTSGSLIQESYFVGALGTTTIQTLTVSAQEGVYELLVLDVAANQHQVRIVVPRAIPFVWLPTRDEPITVNRGFDVTKHAYFYVPKRTSRIVMTLNSGALVRFYKPDGSLQPTTRRGVYEWYCAVPPGLDGQVWSFDGLYCILQGDSPHFENCPNVLALAPEQMMVSASLLSGDPR